MQSKATTVDAYLSELSSERRVSLEAVRKVILANLDHDYEEGMQYGMIGYFIPHRVYPAGYHCDPKQPLPFVGLASQKNYMSLYMMCLYSDGPLSQWFQAEWKKTGKKLDMGKSCIRFKKSDDLALEVIGEAIRRVPASKYIEIYESAFVKKQPATVKSSTKKTAKKKTPRSST
ncbi:MAG: DUF1801 domain-containing protein [Planctomycetota bacterium]